MQLGVVLMTRTQNESCLFYFKNILLHSLYLGLDNLTAVSDLMQEAAEKGLPVARHLFLHYPNDKNVHKLTYEEFLIGSEILVVPVLDKGKNTVKAYFPLSSGCSWKHMWTGKVFSKPLNVSNESNDRIQGFEAQVEAPIGFPAVFVKIGSSIGETFIKNLKDLNIL